MGKHQHKITTFRCSDPNIIKKLDVLSKLNKRTRNNEIEYALCKYIDDYEAENGTININGDVTINGNITINNG